MNPIVRILLGAAFFLSTTVHAELTLDTKYLGLSKELSQLGWDESKPVDKFMEHEDKTIRADLLARNEITPESMITWGAYGHAHVMFNGKDYYLRAFNYQTAAQDKEYDKSLAAKRKSQALPGGGACVLYVNDKHLKKVAALKISLPENHYGTWCNGVEGIGSAGKGRDGVLVSLSYYLTDNKLAKRAEDIGQDWRYMTVLIRFAETNGKLTLTQDDHCLGNPNKYKGIPAARKALSRCESQ
ncbi:hypothetical protein [Paludibacterium denitrificans]|uniref:Uncharacterized protein n=1 Tax=Paludibacterium denitrificans TaxID=2675226 RepID=A0A844GDZ0_9NEIS|nr:hypothetical protein [Paludibacterium denitrificans]MTD33137.1 hypothetical protein [Paludibacterium denitrificans]